MTIRSVTLMLNACVRCHWLLYLHCRTTIYRLFHCSLETAHNSGFASAYSNRISPFSALMLAGFRPGNSPASTIPRSLLWDTWPNLEYLWKIGSLNKTLKDMSRAGYERHLCLNVSLLTVFGDCNVRNGTKVNSTLHKIMLLQGKPPWKFQYVFSMWYQFWCRCFHWMVSSCICYSGRGRGWWSFLVWKINLRECTLIIEHKPMDVELQTIYTLCLKKMCQLWNGIAQNCKDRFWWHLAEILKIL